MNGVHLKVASEKMRYFKLNRANGGDRVVRFLPYVQNLSKQQDSINSSTLKNPEHSLIYGED